MPHILLELIRMEERKLFQRLQWWIISAFASIVILALLLGPFDRPFTTIVFTASVAFLAWLVGFDVGRRRRRFAPLKSTGLRVSQSMGRKGDQHIYKTYDATESETELTLDHAVSLALQALETRVLATHQAQEGYHADGGSWPGIWLFLTCDSHRRPVYVDLKGIVEILAFTNSYIKDHEKRTRIQEALSKISEGTGDLWERAFGT